VKFLRHLGAATVVVAVVVLAGIAWNRFWPGILAGQLAGRVPPGAHVPPGFHLSGPPPGHVTGPGGRELTRLPGGTGGVRVSTDRAGVGTMSLLFRQVNLQVLEHTAKAEAAFAAAVVIIDVIRRRIRRVRRAGPPRAQEATAAGSVPAEPAPPPSGPAE
jgi:hypothetical protein